MLFGIAFVLYYIRMSGSSGLYLKVRTTCIGWGILTLLSRILTLKDLEKDEFLKTWSNYVHMTLPLMGFGHAVKKRMEYVEEHCFISRKNDNNII